jgi:hypothetical protein
MIELFDCNVNINYRDISSKLSRLSQDKLKNIIEYNKQNKKMSLSQALYCILIESKIEN